VSLLGPEASDIVPRDRSPYIGLALALLIALLQATVMPHAAIAGSVPMLPVAAVVSWGILRGPNSGGWWALCLGWLLDWRSTSGFGAYTLPLLAVALLTSIGGRRVFSSNLVLPGVLTAVGSMVFCLLHQALVVPLEMTEVWQPQALVSLIAPAVALNLLWLPVVYFPTRALAEHMAEPRIGWER
jgi:rod shape-determining protein MreD